MAHLLDNTFTNKIDRFIDYDRDRETKFESIFTIREFDKRHLVRVLWVLAQAHFRYWPSCPKHVAHFKSGQK